MFSSVPLSAQYCGHECRCGLRVVADLDHCRVEELRVRGERLIGSRCDTETDQVAIVLERRRQCKRLASPDVVERRNRRVDHRERLLTGEVEDALDLVVVQEVADRTRVGRLERIDVTLEEQVVTARRIGDGHELDGVEVDLAVPPVLVADEGGDRVLRAAVEHERSGADGLLVQRRVGNGGIDPGR